MEPATPAVAGATAATSAASADAAPVVVANGKPPRSSHARGLSDGSPAARPEPDTGAASVGTSTDTSPRWVGAAATTLSSGQSSGVGASGLDAHIRERFRDEDFKGVPSELRSVQSDTSDTDMEGAGGTFGPKSFPGAPEMYRTRASTASFESSQPGGRLSVGSHYTAGESGAADSDEKEDPRSPTEYGSRASPSTRRGSGQRSLGAGSSVGGSSTDALPVTALIVLNMQNDFFEGGSFAVPGSEAIIPFVNQLRSRSFDHVFQCYQTRSANSSSFLSNNPGTTMLETTALPGTGPQMIWPDHCVHGSVGALPHADVVTRQGDVTIEYGSHPGFDVHSPFASTEGRTPRLRQLFQAFKITDVFLVGIAMDYAVLRTALDIRRLTRVKNVYVVEDACLPMSPDTAIEATRRMALERVHVIVSTDRRIDALPRAFSMALAPRKRFRPSGWSESSRATDGGSTMTNRGTGSDVHSSSKSSLVSELPGPGRGKGATAGAGSGLPPSPMAAASRTHSWSKASHQGSPTGPGSAAAPGRKLPALSIDVHLATSASAMSQMTSFDKGHAESPLNASKPWWSTIMGAPSPASRGGGAAAGGTWSAQWSSQTTPRESFTHAGRLPGSVSPSEPRVSLPAVTPSNAIGGRSVGKSLVAKLLDAAYVGDDVAARDALSATSDVAVADAVNAMPEPVGMSPLHIAASRGCTNVVNVLLDYGGDAGVKSLADGSTALLLAVKNDMDDTVKAILAHCDPAVATVANSLRTTPLLQACHNTNEAAVTMLVKAVEKAGNVDVWAHACLPNRVGMTALMAACAVARHGEEENEWGREDVSVEAAQSAIATPKAGHLAGGRSLVARRASNREAVGAESVQTAARIVSHLLSLAASAGQRVRQLCFADSEGWTAIHFAAKSDVLAHINWSMLRNHVRDVDVGMKTKSSRYTPLQLAAWNGHAASVALLVDSHAWPGKSGKNPWRLLVDPNDAMPSRPHTALDLSLAHGHTDCARLIVRAGGVCRVTVGRTCDEFLHRLVLMGDGVAVELCLRHEENGVELSDEVITLAQELRFPHTCSFTFAGYSSRVTQHMFYCTECSQRVCVVCKDKCHHVPTGSYERSHRHRLRYLGLVKNAFCGCKKDTCRAVAAVDQRESEGYHYVPNPLDTSISNLVLVPDSELDTLCDILARNSHEVWARERFQQGWSWGPKRDNTKLLHPMLVPFLFLPPEDKRRERETQFETIKLIDALGFSVENKAGKLLSGKRGGSRAGTAAAGDKRGGLAASAVAASSKGGDLVRQESAAGSTADATARLRAAGSDMYGLHRTGSSSSLVGSYAETRAGVEEVLDDPEVLHAFEEFCKQQYCEENLFLLLDIREYNAIREQRTGEPTRVDLNLKLKEKADHIVDSYVRVGSAHEINIKKQEREALMATIASTGDLASAGDVFAELMRRAFVDLDRDVLPRFRRSAPASPAALSPQWAKLKMHADSVGSRAMSSQRAVDKLDAGITGLGTAKPKMALNEAAQVVLASISEATLATAAAKFVPSPIDTKGVWLTEDLDGLVELLARNYHETWAEAKLKDGWRYSPNRVRGNDDKTSDMLVPYSFLTEREKALSRGGARALVMTMVRLGYKFRVQAGRAAINPELLSYKLTDSALTVMRRQNAEIRDTKQGVFNAFLFAAARRGHTHLLEKLLGVGTSGRQGADINAQEEFGRTPLFLSVARGHTSTTAALLVFGAKIRICDVNRTTVLMIAAYQGNAAVCQMLLRCGCEVQHVDILGMTALHYAAIAGNVDVCAQLARVLARQRRRTDGHPGVDSTRDGLRSFGVVPGSPDEPMRGVNSMRDLMGPHGGVSPPVGNSPMASRIHSPVPDLAASSSADPGSDRALDRMPSKRWRNDIRAGTRTPVASAKDEIAPLTALCLAVAGRHLDCTELLIRHGADPLMAPASDDSAFDLAVKQRARAQDRLTAALAAEGARSNQPPSHAASTMAGPTATKRLRRAIREEDESAAMVDLLFANARVRRHVVKFTVASFLKRAFSSLMTMLLIVLTFSATHTLYAGTQATSLGHAAAWSASVQAQLEASFAEVNHATWLTWLDRNLLWDDGNGDAGIETGGALFQPAPVDLFASHSGGPSAEAPGNDASNASGIALLGRNLVVSPIRVTALARSSRACDGYTCWAPAVQSVLDAALVGASWILPVHSIAQRRAAAAEMVAGLPFDNDGEVSATAAALVLDVALYNRDSDTLGAVRLATTTDSLIGMPLASSHASWVAVRSVANPGALMWPSRTFDIVLASIVGVQLLSVLIGLCCWGSRSMRANGPRSRCAALRAKAPQVAADVTVIAIGATTAAIGFTAHNMLAEVDMASPDRNDPGAMWVIAGLLQRQRLLIGSLLLVSALRALHYLQDVSGIGPLVLAVSYTVRSRTVVAALMCIIVVTAGFATATSVAFGSVAPQFATVGTAAFTLVSGAHVSAPAATDSAALHVMHFCSVAFILTIAVLLAVLLAAATGSFPTALSEARLDWDDRVHQLMESRVQWNAATRRGIAVAARVACARHCPGVALCGCGGSPARTPFVGGPSRSYKVGVVTAGGVAVDVNTTSGAVAAQKMGASSSTGSLGDSKAGAEVTASATAAHLHLRMQRAPSMKRSIVDDDRRDDTTFRADSSTATSLRLVGRLVNSFARTTTPHALEHAPQRRMQRVARSRRHGGRSASDSDSMHSGGASSADAESVGLRMRRRSQVSSGIITPTHGGGFGGGLGRHSTFPVPSPAHDMATFEAGVATRGYLFDVAEAGTSEEEDDGSDDGMPRRRQRSRGRGRTRSLGDATQAWWNDAGVDMLSVAGGDPLGQELEGDDGDGSEPRGHDGAEAAKEATAAVAALRKDMESQTSAMSRIEATVSALANDLKKMKSQ